MHGPLARLPHAVLRPASAFHFDQREEGWKLVRNVRFRSAKMHFHPISVFEKMDLCITWHDFMKRARKIGNCAGQLHAERLMEHKRIPAEWRPFVLAFPGTVWRNGHKRRCIPCLYWNNTHWEISWHWSDIPFHPNTMIVTTTVA